MGAKKKGKKKKGDEDKPKKEVVLIKPSFVPPNIEPLPISIKIKHKKDIYFFFSDEYAYTIDIKKQLSIIANIPIECIKLYLANKRVVEDESTNHDQQIDNTTVIYAAYKNEEENKWEDVRAIINYQPEEGETENEGEGSLKKEEPQRIEVKQKTLKKD